MAALDEFQYADLVAEAARNHQMIRMGYKGEARTVEPYSYRQGKVGTLFYGYHVEAGSIKAFDIGRIEYVEIIEQTFEPKWPVEIG